MNTIATLYSAMQSEISQYKAEVEKDEVNAETLSALEASINQKKARIDQMSKAAAFEQAAEEYGNRLTPRQTATSDLTSHLEKHSYSLSKAIQEAASGRLTGVEAEAHQEQCRYSKPKFSNSVLVPFDTPVAKKWTSLNTTTGAGAYPTVTQPTVFDLLLAQLVAPQVGVQYVGNLMGINKWPRMTTGITPAAAAEGNTGSASSAAMDAVTLTPYPIIGKQVVTNLWLNNASFDAESFLYNHLARQGAVLMDKYIFAGTGSSQPTGALYDSGITTVPIGNNGGPATWALVNQLVSSVDTSNALAANCAFVGTPKSRSHFAITVKNANHGGFLMESDGSMAGYKFVSSNQLPADLTKGTGTGLSAVLFGDFSKVLFGTHGNGMEIITDIYSAGPGSVQVSLYVEFSTAVIYPGAIAAFKDLLP